MAYIKYAGEEAVGRIADYVNKKLTFASSMPESPEKDIIILYVGATTNSFIQGGIYEYDGNNWILINSVQTVELTKAEYDALPPAIQNNGIIYFITDMEIPGNIVEGYYNSVDGKFYRESSYTTEITGSNCVIYISLDTNIEYRYDIDYDEFIQIANTDAESAIVYVNSLPLTDIQNIIYGMISYLNHTDIIANNFLDENNLFEKTIDGEDYTYTAANGKELEAGINGSTYKNFNSLTYNNSTSNWTLTYSDSTSDTLVAADTFYYKEKIRTYYAGNANEQITVPLVTSNSGESESYSAGEGINIANNVISTVAATTSTLGGVKPDDSTIKINANGVLSGVGKQLTEGSTVYIDTEGTTATVGQNAEIFNDYAIRGSGNLSGNVSSGNYSHAEGSKNTATGFTSHAEGYTNLASGGYAHVEGSSNKATGIYSHAEGYQTEASSAYAHAEGQKTIASGTHSHAEGNTNKASGNFSHAEGANTTASENCAHAEGVNTTASGIGAHAEGTYTTASGNESHAEGNHTTVSGSYSHVEGSYAEASEYCTHAEGYRTKAAAEYSHAEGYETETTGQYSHVEGYNAKVTKDFAHGEGFYTEASEEHTHAEGFYTIAAGKNQHVQGHYNKKSTSGSTTGTNGDAFIIGNGTSSNPGANAFRVTFAGAAYGLSAYNSSGADYAEFFEWKDKNIYNEDRVGYFVTLENDKIKKANQGDYILGVISGHPSVVGNGDEDWLGRYIRDDFGRTIEEDIIDEETGEIIGKKFKQNPNYDATQEYIERKDRKEWDYVGMLGTLAVRDNGECKVNEFCQVDNGGIAVPAINGYRVIKRISKNVIQIIFK